MPTTVDADLELTVRVGDAVMHGTLSGQASDLTLDLDAPDLLGGSGTGPARALAELLREHGVRLTVRAGRDLVVIGPDRTSWLQRRITGSPYIRVVSASAALRLLALRRAARRAAPLVPPSTPLPLLPTFLRRPRTVTTTHDPDHGGYARLVMAPNPYARPGEQRPAYLLGGTTTIGSAADSDIRLPGLEPRHAEVRHTADDEFVLVHLDQDTPTLLRTGARVELGTWTLVYVREEYADHGRPHGGRIGGELGHQLPQRPRDA